MFCTAKNLAKINRNDTIFEYKEAEGTTIIIGRNKAGSLKLKSHFLLRLGLR
ncbi:ACT domain-containing protein [Lutibacter citreus]|uniref:ACT domain-containing protein n=1 Tax=Lutibacter citreus TaxID=2138210 RepID=UPI001C54FE01|nr:ACT domain-containing protein [Lutibacter citreus]